MDEVRVLAAIAALRSELLGEVTGLRTAVMGKLEQVQNELTAIRSDLTVASAAAVRAVKRTDADREDMRDLNELVTSMMVSLRILRTEVDELKGRKE